MPTILGFKHTRSPGGRIHQLGIGGTNGDRCDIASIGSDPATLVMGDQRKVRGGSDRLTNGGEIAGDQEQAGQDGWDEYSLNLQWHG